MFCTKCGAKNEDGALFCMQCGNKLTAAEPELKELVEEPTEEVVAPRRRESTKRRGAYAKPKPSKAPLVIAIAVVAVVAVVVMIIAGNSGSSSSSVPATETDTAETSEEETSTVDISEILVELQEKFKQETQTSPYLSIYIGMDEDGEYGVLRVYRNEDSFASGEEDPIEYYYIDAEGNITDNVGNSISLDNFTVRDEVLAALTARDNFWNVFEEERQDPDANAYITEAADFSEERAWIIISEGSNKYEYVIDTDGNVIYEVSPSEVGNLKSNWTETFDGTDFVNGVSLIGENTLIDADGNTVWSVEDNGWSEAERIFGSGSVTDISLEASDPWSGYPLVTFSVDTYENTGEYEGLLNSDGTWLIEPELGKNVSFGGTEWWYQIRNTVSSNGGFVYDDNYKIFIAEDYLINSEKGKFFYNAELKTQLDITSEQSAIYQWYLSDVFEAHNGLLYDEDVNGFVDANGATVIDLTKYTLDSDLLISYKYYPTFYNGYCILFLKNEGGGHYLTVIDTQGNQLFEPVKNSYYDAYAKLFGRVSSERIYINGEKQYLDLQGQYVGDEYEDLSAYSDGLALVQKSCESASGNTIYTYLYIDADGNDVFDVISNVSGQSSASSGSSYTDDSDETSESEEKEYTFINNFSIEGKWKSVGDWGYGQAQPGAIVAFDGKNCNLYSPMDTYAFYADGDHYVLDATSVLSGTVTFKVYIIDENNIDLVVSGGTTELTRVE